MQLLMCPIGSERLQKEYGKLTEDQIKRLVKKLPEIRKQEGELQEAFRSASKEKLREIIGDGIWWAPLYEMSLVQGLGLLFYVLGKAEWLREVAQSPDPQEEVLKEIYSEEEWEWDGGPDGKFSKGDVIALIMALQRNVLSIMVYKRSLSSLIEEARGGNDDCLFDAIRLDRTIVSGPTATARISKAELLGEKRFFQRLLKALKGPSQKHWEGFKDLRYSLAILRDLGLNDLSDSQLEHLLVDVLGVYPKSFSARKNLRAQYYQSKKIKTL
ncbi:MAG: hypothetical protein V1796_07135 [Pseudomonadota bacterium]